MKVFKTILACIITTIILIFTYFISHTFFEPITYDFMTKYAVTQKLPFDKKKNVKGHSDIVIILVDNKTIEKYRWPWKREKWCKIYNYLYEYGKPKVIAHDGLIASLDTEYPESDKKFFDTIAKSDIVMQGFSPMFDDWDSHKEGLKYEQNFVRKYYVNAKIKNTEIPQLYRSILKMPEPYMNAIKHVGSTRMMMSFINGNLEPYARGEKYRNYEYFINYKGEILPSFALKAFLIAKGNPKMVITKKYMEFPELNYKVRHKITKYQTIVPIKFYNREGADHSHIEFSAVDIIDSYDNLKKGITAIVDPKLFEDKIVIIGTNADGAADAHPTSISASHQGVDIQATAIDNILHNDFLKVVPDYVNCLIALLGVFLVYMISKHHKVIDSYIIITLLSVLYLLLTCIFYYFGIIVNITTPIIVWTVATIPLFIYKLYKLESEQ